MSSSHLFSEGDLVFAKVRGFPNWPARVNGTIHYPSNTYPIVFFGTQETANLNSKHLLAYEENRETITRGRRIKRTYNLAFDQIESESSAKRARWTIPCQAEGSGEDVITMSEDVGETDIEERKDQFLRTVERLLKPSARKKHVIGREKKKRTGLEK
ncbi:hepatoma-derived growth factor-related protein 3-like, partial [Acropora millepora]|uniref:hepatoma-derived growth factor-related protein 3-like n=1 Tax=Acropora millepora TaxID=45264 RepID=UPI001CF5DBFF